MSIRCVQVVLSAILFLGVVLTEFRLLLMLLLLYFCAGSPSNVNCICIYNDGNGDDDDCVHEIYRMFINLLVLRWTLTSRLSVASAISASRLLWSLISALAVRAKL